MTTQEEEKLAPVHPGDVLLHDFMAPLGLSAYRVAKDIGVAPIVISGIVRHKRAVTAKTALLLAKYLGTSPDLWLGLQTDYDLETAAPQYRSLVDDGAPFALAASVQIATASSVGFGRMIW